MGVFNMIKFLLTRILHVLHDDLLAVGGVDHLLALTGRDHRQAEARKSLIFHKNKINPLSILNLKYP